MCKPINMETMNAVVVEEYGNLNSVCAKEIPVPVPQEDFALVKMEFAPINVIDEITILGHHTQLPTPRILGSEGSGTVVKSGGGQADSLVGKRVAVMAEYPGSSGTWAEYSVVHVSMIFPLSESTSFEQAASFVVNPGTVALFMQCIKEGGYPSIIQNAAASSLGKMLVRWCQKEGIQTVNLVRRREQVEALKNIGAEHVLNTSEQGWVQEASKLCNELDVRIGFDPVAGLSTNDLMTVIKEPGVVYNYGSLASQTCEVSAMLLIVQKKRLEGLCLPVWLAQLSPQEKERVSEEIEPLLPDVLKTDYSGEYNFSNIKDALEAYKQKKTDSKFLIKIG